MTKNEIQDKIKNLGEELSKEDGYSHLFLCIDKTDDIITESINGDGQTIALAILAFLDRVDLVDSFAKLIEIYKIKSVSKPNEEC